MKYKFTLGENTEYLVLGETAVLIIFKNVIPHFFNYIYHEHIILWNLKKILKKTLKLFTAGSLIALRLHFSNLLSHGML